MDCKRILASLLLAATFAFGSAAAHAGRSCEPHQPTVIEVERGLRLAQRTQQALEYEHARDGTEVVLLARAGQDLRKYGLQWSHMGIAYRVVDPWGQPAWIVLHKLNACGTATADLYRQGLGPFFLDDPWRFETAWSVPAPEVQRRLLALLANDARVTRMHQRAYSMVSYAWGVRYQQSNQWALETLAEAMDPEISSRVQAQGWLQWWGYQPTALHLGPLTRLGGELTAANIAFDDHPPAKRFNDIIETVTVDSVFAWMQRSGLGSAPVQLQ